MEVFMNKQLLIGIVLVLLILGLQAHPAGNVKAEYDAETQLLSVNFAHKVRDAADHFIVNIVVQVNGKKAIEQVLSRQENPDGGSLVYKLVGIKKGDKISVVTDCNKGGKRTANITLE
jgi:hypothetical protein